MRKREHYWSLFHNPENNQLDGLRTDQVEAIYSALPPKMREDWFIWKEDFDGWRPLTEFPSILIGLRKSDENKVILPPEPPSQIGKPVSGDFKRRVTYEAPDALTAALSLETKVRPEDRGQVRFDRKLEIRIYGKDKVYPNQSVDISTTGMQVRDPLPAGLPKSFKVEIRVANKVIPVTASEMKPKSGPSNRLKLDAGEYDQALFTLLLATT